MNCTYEKKYSIIIGEIKSRDRRAILGDVGEEWYEVVKIVEARY